MSPRPRLGTGGASRRTWGSHLRLYGVAALAAGEWWGLTAYLGFTPQALRCRRVRGWGMAGSHMRVLTRSEVAGAERRAFDSPLFR